MINIPGLDTSRWSITDHNDFWTGFVKEMLRGWWEDLMLRAAPESQTAKRIHSRRHLVAKRWFG